MLCFLYKKPSALPSEIIQRDLFVNLFSQISVTSCLLFGKKGYQYSTWNNGTALRIYEPQKCHGKGMLGHNENSDHYFCDVFATTAINIGVQ